jgi:hypothetical protein
VIGVQHVSPADLIYKASLYEITGARTTPDPTCHVTCTCTAQLPSDVRGAMAYIHLASLLVQVRGRRRYDDDDDDDARRASVGEPHNRRLSNRNKISAGISSLVTDPSS